jgi:hypothetical protein
MFADSECQVVVSLGVTELLFTLLLNKLMGGQNANVVVAVESNALSFTGKSLSIMMMELM